MMRRVGAGRITAEVVAGATRLTELSHSSPARLFPIQAVGTERTGATGFVFGGFGGGLLGGDKVDYRLRVGTGATLVGWTQGTTKVYQTKKDLLPAVQNMEVEVGPGALLVLGPDPVMPFARSRYIQQQRFKLTGDASVVVVDSVCCGRAAQGERWQLSSYSSTNEYFSSPGPAEELQVPSEQSKPFLADAVVLDVADRGASNWSMDLGASQRDAFASIVTVGPRAAAVGAEMKRLAAAVGARGGARVVRPDEIGSSTSILPNLGGWVCMGISQGIPGGRPDVTVCRIIAELPEDVNRLIARCMHPLATDVGAEVLPYSGRVHGSSLASSAPVMRPAATRETEATASENSGDAEEQTLKASSTKAYVFSARGQALKAASTLPVAGPSSSVTSPSSAREGLDSHQFWALLQLADPTLPVNGFAHSAGLEAATHASVFQDQRDGAPHSRRWQGARQRTVPPGVLEEYFVSAANASARLYAPFAAAAHRCMAKAMKSRSVHEGALAASGSFVEEWTSLNQRLAALLAPVAPAHRASTVQGAALLNIAQSWLHTASPRAGAVELIDTARKAQLPIGVHYACTMGLVGAALDLPEDVTLDAFGYASLRALVSAAIRLSLLGPQRAVGFQAASSQRWAEAFSSAAREIEVSQAANTAPLLDTVHGLHDLLEARLFQT